MALIVETGAIVAGADSYVDLAYADQYHADRGNAAWGSASIQVKEAALRNATQFLDMRYHGRWKGLKVNPLQARQFPRAGIYLGGLQGAAAEALDGGSAGGGWFPSNSIPEAVKHANCELGLRALAGPLAADLPRGGRVQSRKVDILETTFFQDAPGHTVYQLVDLLLGEFVVSNAVTRLVRV